MDDAALFGSLLKWLRTFDEISGRRETAEDVSDGVALCEVMAQIAPERLDLASVKRDAGGNWRLRLSNLKKLMVAVADFYEDVLGHVLTDAEQPDLAAVAERASVPGLVRVLELLVGCAVHCDRRDAYIARIMAMDAAQQHALMAVIQRAMERPRADSFSEHALDVSAAVGGAHDGAHDSRASLGTVEALLADRRELETRFEQLRAEHRNLLVEHERAAAERDELAQRLREATSGAADPKTPAGKAHAALRAENERLKEDLDRAEAARDEARALAESQRATISELQQRGDLLGREAADARQLRDELEVLRHAAEKAGRLEAQVEAYRRRAEETAELRRQLRAAEEQGNTYLQRTMALEDELQKSSGYKSQIETLKRRVADLEKQSSEATAAAATANFEAGRLRETAAQLQAQCDRHRAAADEMRERLEEAALRGQLGGGGEGGAAAEGAALDGAGAAVVATLRERMLRLERENEALRASGGGDAGAMQAVVDEASAARARLERELAEAMQRAGRLDAECAELRRRVAEGEAAQLRMGDRAIAYEQLAEAERSAARARAAAEAATSERAQLQATLDAARRELTDAQRELVELRTRCSLIGLDQQELERRLSAALEAEWAGRVEAASAAAAAELAALRARVVELEGQLAAAKGEAERLGASERALQRARGELEAKCGEQSETITRLLTEKDRLHERGNEAQERLVDLNRRLVEAQSALQLREEEMRRLRAEAAVAASSSDGGAWQQRLEEERERVHGLELRIVEKDGLLAERQRRYEEADANAKRLAAQLEERTAEKIKLEGYYEQANKIIQQLRVGGRATGDQQREFEEALRLMQNTLDERNAEIEFLRESHRKEQEARDREEQLVVSAWYELGLRLPRKGVTARQPSFLGAARELAR